MKNLLLFFFILISGYCFSQPRLSEQVGVIKSSSRLPNGMAFDISNAYATLTVYSPTTIRVRVSRQKPAKDFSYAIDNLSTSLNFNSVANESENFVLTTDSLKVIVNAKPFRVSFYNNRGNLLNSDEAGLGISWWGN